MHTSRKPRRVFVAASLAAALIAAPSFAQTDAASPAKSGASTGMPSADEMKMMMEMAQTNDNHKLLASMDGNWDYVVRFWMNGDPSTKPQESKGTAVRKSIMGGRFFTMDELLESIETVTAEDVQRIARTFFDPKQIALTILGNLENFKITREDLAC
jgi:hypothetical protein